MAHSGFRRILIVNGHGGNSAVQQFALEWAADHPGCRVLFHNWWNAPRTWAKVQAIDPVASHGSWMENFPWTRLPGVEHARRRSGRWWTWRACARSIRSRCAQYLGDGNFGGLYQRSDDEMLALWQVAVDETRALLDRLVGRRVLSGAADHAMSHLGRGRDRRHAGRVSRARRPRRHPGRHGRRARRRHQRATACASPGRSTSSRVRVPAFTPATLTRHVGHDHPRHQGASHRGRRPRAAAAPRAPAAAWSRRRTGSTSSRSRRSSGAERTVGAFVNFGADYLEPGVIHYGGRGAVVVGEIDGRITPRVDRDPRRVAPTSIRARS